MYTQYGISLICTSKKLYYKNHGTVDNSRWEKEKDSSGTVPVVVEPL